MSLSSHPFRELSRHQSYHDTYFMLKSRVFIPLKMKKQILESFQSIRLSALLSGDLLDMSLRLQSEINDTGWSSAQKQKYWSADYTALNLAGFYMIFKLHESRSSNLERNHTMTNRSEDNSFSQVKEAFQMLTGIIEDCLKEKSLKTQGKNFCGLLEHTSTQVQDSTIKERDNDATEAESRLNFNHIYTDTVGSNEEVRQQLFSDNPTTITHDHCNGPNNNEVSVTMGNPLQQTMQTLLQTDDRLPPPVLDQSNETPVTEDLTSVPPSSATSVVYPPTPPMVKRTRKRIIRDLRDNGHHMPPQEKSLRIKIAKKLCEKDKFLIQAIEDAEIPDSPGNVIFSRMLQQT